MSELTNGQKEEFLRAAIKAELIEEDEDGYRWCYIGDWTDSWVVYETNAGYFEIDYSMDDAGAVTFSGEPKPKVAQTNYVDAPEGEQLGRTSAMERRESYMRSIRMGRDVRQTGGAVIKSEPLTYHQRAPYSFYRDMILTDRVQGAAERLQRHRQEMDVISKEREAHAMRALHAGEVRATPSTTDGLGGYLAPPAWLNDLFATGKRAGRVLANRIPGQFPLPSGVSSVNVPILTTGTQVLPAADGAGVADRDITDAAGTSAVTTLVGQADVALQDLEQSPAGAHIDWALFLDMSQDYDAQLEYQLMFGLGVAAQQILGLYNVANIVSVTYTDSGPTGKAMYPYLGQMAAQIGDGRLLPPEVWLTRTARWAWLTSSEDSSLRPLEFPSMFGDDNPGCPGAPLGWPALVDDAIPATINTTGTTLVGGTNDAILACRPSDLILMEGTPQTSVMREPLSSTLGVRIQMHNGAACITNRYPSGIARMIGNGLAVQSGY